MPRYYFNIVLPGRVIIDANGKELASLQAAHLRALEIATQARAYAPDAEELFTIHIQDETRFTQEIFVPSFNDLASCKRLNKPLTKRAQSAP